MSAARALRPLRVGVVGAGGWGRNHLRVLKSLPEVELVGVSDRDPERRRAAESEEGVRGFEDLAALAGEGLDAVTIAVPTPAHHAVALDAIARGLHLLVEKPIASTVAEADEILARARQQRLVLSVGHVERWNPAFEAVKARSRRPHFVEVHRLAPFNPRGTDVAVVLDLMIHDLDLVLALVGRPVTAVDAVGVAVLSREIDIANARLEFEGGAIANVTTSRISIQKTRKIRVFEEDTYLSADLVSRAVACFRKRPAEEGEERIGESPYRIEQEPVEVSTEEPLTREMRAFAAAVRGERSGFVTGEEGRAALDVACRILDAIERRRAALDTSPKAASARGEASRAFGAAASPDAAGGHE
jgi:predicted dehydrogenase